MFETILVVSHRRSGTHWTIDSIRHNFASVERKYIDLDKLLPNHPKPLDLNDVISKLESSDEKIILKSHLAGNLKSHLTANVRDYNSKIDSLITEVFENSKIVYVVRDGRDVMTSLYHYIKSLAKKEFTTTFSEFLRQKRLYGELGKLNRIEYWKYHVESWIDRDNIIVVPYESLHSSYTETLNHLEKYLCLAKQEKVSNISMDSSSKQSSAVRPRKGIVGDWKNHFSEEDTIFFEEIAGDLLDRIKLKSKEPSSV